MSKLVQALDNITYTANGAVTFKSTGSACLDLFSVIGASRGKDVSGAFLKSLEESLDVTLRILLWSRDVRGGAGERGTFKRLVSILIDKVEEGVVHKIIQKTPEIGRWDDLDLFWDTKYEKTAASFWLSAIQDGNGLASKWAPSKFKNGAAPLAKAGGFKVEREWRKFLVPLRSTVEQLMCAREWEEIPHGKLPSLASSRYDQAFQRHDDSGLYAAYKAALEKGEVKINAGALFPYDPIKAFRNTRDAIVPAAQWAALKDFITTDRNFLPIIDVSGSMSTPVGGNPNLRAVDVAASLGMYLAERNKGLFKDVFLNFHSTPKLIQLKGSFAQRVDQVYQAPWGGSTDLQKSFKLILDAAVANNLGEEDMPTHILLISDMEFNRVEDNWGNNKTNFQAIEDQYQAAGYKRPQIIFWRVDSGAPNAPIKFDQFGTALVSGFSPAIIKPLLEGGDLSPMKAMLDVIMVDRYSL